MSDWLEVMLLQKETGLLHGRLGHADDPATNGLMVIPLFETIADLQNAPHIMGDFFALPGIKANTASDDHIPAKQMQFMRFDGKQWQRFGDILAAN